MKKQEQGPVHCQSQGKGKHLDTCSQTTVTNAKKPARSGLYYPENLSETVVEGRIGLVSAALRIERFTQIDHEYGSNNASQGQRCFLSVFSLGKRPVLGCGSHAVVAPLFIIVALVIRTVPSFENRGQRIVMCQGKRTFGVNQNEQNVSLLV